MFSVCANPDCKAPSTIGKDRFFRFHKDHPVGEKPPNTHSVQHFWLCGVCCDVYTLEYRDRMRCADQGLPAGFRAFKTRYG